MSTGQAASIGRIQVLRVATFFLALLVASTGTLLAYVSAVLVYAAFGLVIAAVLVLLVHQPINPLAILSAILLAMAFIVPATLVHETYSSALCVGGVPCDPVPNSHLGLRVGLAAMLFFAALVAAVLGRFRSARLHHTPHPRHQSLA